MKLISTAALFLMILMFHQDSWAGKNQVAPGVDYFLKAVGQSTTYWHKDAISSGTDKEGIQHWIVSAADTPHRGDDGGCISSARLWSVVIDHTNSVQLEADEDDPRPNPDTVNFLNFDPKMKNTPCENIAFRDYFSADANIPTHLAFTLLKDLADTVDCVRRGESSCPPWIKMDIPELDRTALLTLNSLPVQLMEWDDPQSPNTLEIQYLLMPPTANTPMPVYLVVEVHMMSGGTMWIDVTREEPDPA